ncbi:MAG TPA: hypothetical protein VLS89_03040 [Candidatus Nanopelagicales bacterium]|nr:hypothetical protein [Candidatus Nanopelagicales bacterium]
MTRRAREGEPRPPWWVGAARFEVGALVEGHPLVVAARCRLGSMPSATHALLDTGAQWSVVGGELAAELEQEAEEEGREIVLHSRLGQVKGRICRLGVTLVAEEGADLLVQASLVISPEWPAPPVLGYGGFLDRIRFGLDPGSSPADDRWIFFGCD